MLEGGPGGAAQLQPDRADAAELPRRHVAAGGCRRPRAGLHVGKRRPAAGVSRDELPHGRPGRRRRRGLRRPPLPGGHLLLLQPLLLIGRRGNFRVRVSRLAK